LRKRGVVVSRWRRTRWQEIIVAQASYLEYECERLGNGNHQNGAAWRRRSDAAGACQAGKAVVTHLNGARQAAGDIDRQAKIERLVNMWSGALASIHRVNRGTSGRVDAKGAL
jgi:hypothetical protein